MGLFGYVLNFLRL